MTQIQLPMFPATATSLNDEVAFHKHEGKIVYFNGTMPIFSHDEKDSRSFHMITAYFCISGIVKQVDICRVLNITRITMKRAVKTFRENGPSGFFYEPGRRGASKLTSNVLEQAQSLLDSGVGIAVIAEKHKILPNTLYKAISNKRLRRIKTQTENSKSSAAIEATTRSQRSIFDSAAPMGMATTDTFGRVAASFGDSCPVQPIFRTSVDVPNAGVLFAIPALVGCGLLMNIERHFSLPKGYYGINTIFLALAFLALGRIHNPDASSREDPGEWGKLLGMDRMPEVRTLRDKIKLLGNQIKEVAAWSLELCQMWMSSDSSEIMALYIDGHVRVYHGEQTKLPRHHVARQRLCLRATVDYWVNASDGQPYFKINQAVDPGILQTLTNIIIPRLEQDIPNQPGEQYLSENPFSHRFCIVFDREGYSPTFFANMEDKRIACLTYNKFPGDDWATNEFELYSVTVVNGNTTEMKLGERGTQLSNGLWVREIRLLTERGHQTSILTTDYMSPLVKIAVGMFSRWSQENYFRYARQHFDLDRLSCYETSNIPETTPVVNPAYRSATRCIRAKSNLITRKMAILGRLSHDAEGAEIEVSEKPNPIKEKLVQEIGELEQERDKLKFERKSIKSHIKIAELPEDEKFKQLDHSRKNFMDMIKMVVYRAETAMVSIVREVVARKDDARTLMQSLFNMNADIIPDQNNKILTIKLHHSANNRSDAALRHLCDELNATKTVFPGTDLELNYKMVS